MTDKVFVDTNVFVYLFDRDARVKQARAAALVEEEAEAIVISTQVLQEFYVTVTRKLGKPLPKPEAEAAVRRPDGGESLSRRLTPPPVSERDDREDEETDGQSCHPFRTAWACRQQRGA